MIRLLLVAVILLVPACGDAVHVEEEPVLRPVRTLLIDHKDTTRERAFTGLSQSTQETRISFKVGGTITELPVRTGSQMTAGDVLARLNRSSFDLEVQQVEASLAQAQASQRNASANYERVKGLYAGNNASRNDLDAARASAESAGAQVRSIRKTLEIAQLNRSYTTLTVPGDCVVAALNVELNENIGAGEPVARMNCGAGIQINVAIPESLIASVSEGMASRVSFNAISDRQFSGTVTEIGVANTGGSATFPVVVTLDETTSAIRSGMAAEAVFRFEQAGDDTIVVPAAAVIQDERGTFVYIAEPNGDVATIRRRPVVTGELVEEGIQIVEGLAIGEQVVTAGVSVIRENLQVLIAASP
ncbi:MAG: efflux RND transporter periplasmic adaptor subunit [Pseudomonadota bacterium]